MPPPAPLDHQLCVEMAEHIEKLTTSGQPNLDVDLMKKVKKICRQSDLYVSHAYHQVMTQMEKEHSEVRLSAFQIVDELFNRSHCFRELLLKDFNNFMDLTIETDPDFPLPPPKPAAKTLKSKCIQAIQEWHEKFGDVYKKLALGYNFLNECKKVDFEDVRARTIAERRRSEENQRRQEALMKQRVNTAVQEMAEMSSEIKDCLKQAQSCLLLLLPAPEMFQLPGLSSPEPKYTSADSKHLLGETSKPGAAVKAESKTEDTNITDDRTVDSCSIRNSPLPSTSESNPESTLQSSASGLNEFESTGGEAQVKQEPQSQDSNLAKETNHSAPTAKDITIKQEELAEDEEKEKEEDNEEEEDDSDEFEEISDETEDEEEDDLVRGHGLGSQKYSLNIELSPEGVHLKETPDNTDILHALKDCVQLVNNEFIPSLQKWMEIFSKAGNQEVNIRKAIDFKQLVLQMKTKICQLRVSRMKPAGSDNAASSNTKTADDDEEEEDFEEVPEKEGYEARIPDHLREEYGLVPKPAKPSTSRDWTMPAPSRVKEDEAKQEEQDPASWAATLKKLQEDVKEEEKQLICDQDHEVHLSKAGSKGKVKGQSKRKDDLIQKAPVMPFGTDLFHWGEKIETPLMVKIDSEHRGWIPERDGDIVDVNALESMKSRLINFVGDFKPVKWKCRAPLSTGALCERMDRVKCPFHGKILPRNELGEPVRIEDRLELERQKEKQQEEGIPDWEDPQLQADIKAATGIDLSRKGRSRSRGRGKGKGKGQRRKYPNLTDIKKVTSTSRTRLEAKILSPKAQKRVAAAMDSLEAKKFKDKFGNTFVNTFPTSW